MAKHCDLAYFLRKKLLPVLTTLCMEEIIWWPMDT